MFLLLKGLTVRIQLRHCASRVWVRQCCRRQLLALSVFLVLLVLPLRLLGQTDLLGDLDGDNQITILDVVRLLDHINGKAPLSTNLIWIADVNQDSVINQDDATILANTIVGVIAPVEVPYTRILSTSPEDGESNVSVNREVMNLTFM